MIKLIKKIFDNNPKKNTADNAQQYAAEIDKLTADMEDIMDRRAVLARNIMQLSSSLAALLDKAEQLGDWNKKIVADQYNKTHLELETAKREFDQLGNELEIIRQQLAVYSAPIPKETIDPEVIQRVLDNIELRTEDFLRKYEEFNRMRKQLDALYKNQASAVSNTADAFSQALAEKQQKAEVAKPLTPFDLAMAERAAAKSAAAEATAKNDDDNEGGLPDPLNAAHYFDGVPLQKEAEPFAAPSKPTPLISEDMFPTKSVKYTEDYIHQKTTAIAHNTSIEGV